LPKESAKSPSNRILTTLGFFSFIDSAPIALVYALVSAAWKKDRPLRPLNASLANLVKVSRNLFSLSGIMANLWSELTRHAHLVCFQHISRWSRKMKPLLGLIPL
jgi:hypothetical protein